MINSVRNTVMSILNKDNNGYITPEEFNSFAKQAQLEIFNQYFVDFKNSKLEDFKGMESSGYSDITKQLDQTIDYFSKNVPLVYDSPSQTFAMPDGWFLLNALYYNQKEIEHVDQRNVYKLLQSNLTAPNELYPAYVMQGDNMTIYPLTITSGVETYYVRFPYDPKWTYTLVNGSPLFNQSAGDYQDFELTESDFPKLVIKICEYAGTSIREQEVVSAAKQQEVYMDQMAQ
jgi:hypothetical protein